ncbi:unnamed protein product [Rotaria magnacalcarata]|uniref:Cyclic nucleotide-gated channel C-terminal leucine zipper domain-containing protein n=1 Tax=Rotaria magnacalcarata TaxID=392030 RepID=A0A816URY0_9BILA|nr:unnamed protein product [Rotaria magnacalcarata]
MPIFAEAQPCLLAKLVTQLKLQIFSQNDHVYRKRRNVVFNCSAKVFVTFEEGSAFGNISIVNIPATIEIRRTQLLYLIYFLESKIGNRRTVNIRSVVEYLSAHDVLIEHERAYLHKRNLLDEDVMPEKKTTQLEKHIDNLEICFARILVECKANVSKLNQRL